MEYVESSETTRAFERFVEKLTKENLWIYIIRLLKERPMYAYEVLKALRERFGINPATVTVYVVLYKMRREGLVTCTRDERGRVIYRPTEKGLMYWEKAKEFLQYILKTVFES